MRAKLIDLTATILAMADRRNDIDRFAHWAPTYDRSYLQRLVFEPVHTTTLDALGRRRANPRAILDVGCGTGQLLRRAAARFPAAELVGVDPAAEMVRQAEASQPPGIRVRFVQAAAEHLPFPDASFDLVVSSMSFHHWADQQAGLREIRRVLAADGLLALADGFAAGWLRLAFRIAGKRDRVHTPAELDAMLARQNLTTIARHVLARTSRSLQVVLSTPTP